MITEDESHKANFVRINKNLERENRYKDMLPCIKIFNCLDTHNIALIEGSSEIENNFDSLYVNASYISVKLNN